MRTAFADSTRLLVVSYERRHVVTSFHERIENRCTDVSGGSGQEDPHGRPYIIVQSWPATRSSTFSTTSPTLAVTFSSTTTAFEAGRTRTKRQRDARSILQSNSTISVSRAAMLSSSGVRTGRNGLPRSGAVCSEASSSYRLTIAPRRIFCYASAELSRQNSC